MRPYALLAALVLCSIAAPVGAQPALPAAIPPPDSDPVVETRFGTTTTDPFRRLEDLKDSEVQAWMKAEANRTRTILDSIPGHKALLADIERLSKVTPSKIEGGRLLTDGRILQTRKEAGGLEGGRVGKGRVGRGS